MAQPSSHGSRFNTRRSASTRGAARSGLLVAIVGSLCIASFMSGCDGDDDDDSASTGGKGGSSGKGGKAGTGGKAGSSAKAGSSSVAGEGGGNDGGRGGTNTSGTAGRTGAGGSGGDAATGGTSAASGQAGEPSEGGQAGQGALIDPSQYVGMTVFRHDTFGDEEYWTKKLRLHEAIQAALDPTTALGLGLKVDSAMLPDGILNAMDLGSPATTLSLIGLDAVLGVKGTVENGVLTSVGITCALCHSNVDDSVMPGIGLRIDGAANRDLDPGAIIALSPGLADDAEALSVLNSWGPGYYDPRWNQDGINHPVLIPPIYGLSGVPLETYTGDGPVSYWNAYVAVTQMHGIGTFFDPRIDVAVIYDHDLVTPKLPSLFDYQMTLEPAPVAASAFDDEAAERGETLFEGAAQCSSCHSGERLTDAAETLHAASETGMDPLTATRSATGLYRTTPLRALLAHPPYFHDGSAATLADVVTHYDTTLSLALSAEQQADLVEYLKSL
jgi:hypothetical protein